MKKDARIAPGDLRLEKRKGIPNPRPPQLVESLSIWEKVGVVPFHSLRSLLFVVAVEELGSSKKAGEAIDSTCLSKTEVLTHLYLVVGNE